MAMCLRNFRQKISRDKIVFYFDLKTFNFRDLDALEERFNLGASLPPQQRKELIKVE